MDTWGLLMSTGKKRFWSDEEKRSICAQTQTPVVSVAQVARLYAMNATLIHRWLRDLRFAPEQEKAALPSDVSAAFLPIEVEGIASFPPLPRLPAPPCVSAAPLSAQRVDITLSDGWRVLFEGTMALSVVLGLVEGLMP